MRPCLAPLLGMCALLGLVLLPGCGRAARPATAVDTLVIGNGAEPLDLDPHIVTAYTDQNILLALYEGLTAIDEKTSQAIPAAAASWEQSPDGLSWTFHLRPGLAWSNGEPLVAADFAASWRRILNPDLGAENAYLLYAIRGAQDYNEGRSKDPSTVGIETPDERTLRILLGHPVPYLPVLAALPSWFPVNPRVVASFKGMTARGAAWTRPGNLVGNGPFVLEEWQPNARIVVARNPRYWDAGSVALRRLVFLPVENPGTEERQFRAGQLQVTYALPLPKIGEYREHEPSLLRVDPFLQTFFLRFNTTRKPLGDERVRAALSLAIDRATLSSRVLSGAYPAAFSFTPPDCGGYTARARVAFDPERARALLAQAGFPGGKGFPSLEVQVRNDEVQPRVLEALQEMWRRELGIQVTIATLEQKSWLENQRTLAYAISTSGWAGDFLDPVTFLDLFVGSGGNNWTGWSDPAYDALVRQASSTLDASARPGAFQPVEAYLLEHGPVAPLYYGAHAYLIRPEVHGWEPALLGYHRYARVRLGP
jgi:oligopeptide transport system substrate-binding protein